MVAWCWLLPADSASGLLIQHWVYEAQLRTHRRSSSRWLNAQSDRKWWTDFEGPKKAHYLVPLNIPLTNLLESCSLAFAKTPCFEPIGRTFQRYFWFTADYYCKDIQDTLYSTTFLAMNTLSYNLWLFQTTNSLVVLNFRCKVPSMPHSNTANHYHLISRSWDNRCWWYHLSLWFASGSSCPH